MPSSLDHTSKHKRSTILRKCLICGKAFQAPTYALGKYCSMACVGKANAIRLRKPRIAPTEKQCSRCKKWFPATTEYFYVDPSRRDGFRPQCKACKRDHQRHWNIQNPQKSRGYTHTRRALKRATEGTHTAEDILIQLKRQKGRCYYCGEKCADKYHVDHVIPLSRGGSNGPDNLVIACTHCNERKGTKLPHEWPEGGRLL